VTAFQRNDTVTTSGDVVLIAALVTRRYKGVLIANLSDPIGTITACDYHGLATIYGRDSQGFPGDYISGDDPAKGLKLSKSAR